MRKNSFSRFVCLKKRRRMFNVIVGVILCLVVINYHDEIVSFAVHSGAVDSAIGYLENLKK